MATGRRTTASKPPDPQTHTKENTMWKKADVDKAREMIQTALCMACIVVPIALVVWLLIAGVAL